MKKNNEYKLLRVFMSNTDRLDRKPLYEVIVYEAKKHELAGATVLKGIMGFGSSSMVNSLKMWEISEKLPVVVEIIDEKEKIEKFYEIILPFFEKINKGILITIEKANVVFAKTGKKK